MTNAEALVALSDALETREAYDIACAMRGPDLSSLAAEELKALTTAVVRYLIGFRPAPEWRNGLPMSFGPHGNQVASPEEALAYWNTLSLKHQRWILETAWSLPHFTIHLKRALKALPDGPAWLDKLIEMGLC